MMREKLTKDDLESGSFFVMMENGKKVFVSLSEICFFGNKKSDASRFDLLKCEKGQVLSFLYRDSDGQESISSTGSKVSGIFPV